LEMHHDEDLCVLLQAADDELQHPVVRKAVRKSIAARLRRLGLADDYDVGWRRNTGLFMLTCRLRLSRGTPIWLPSCTERRMEVLASSLASCQTT
jgi:hypothetical protein